MSTNGKVKLVNLDEEWKPLFVNVSCGQMFLYEDELCVRIGGNNPTEWEAFGFVRKGKFHIPHTERVCMVDCELRYKNAVIEK